MWFEIVNSPHKYQVDVRLSYFSWAVRLYASEVDAQMSSVQPVTLLAASCLLPTVHSHGRTIY